MLFIYTMKSTLNKCFCIGNQDMRPFQNFMGFPSFHNLFAMFISFFLHNSVTIKPIRSDRLAFFDIRLNNFPNRIAIYLIHYSHSGVTNAFSVCRCLDDHGGFRTTTPPFVSAFLRTTKEGIVYFYCSRDLVSRIPLLHTSSYLLKPRPCYLCTCLNLFRRIHGGTPPFISTHKKNSPEP